MSAIRSPMVVTDTLSQRKESEKPANEYSGAFSDMERVFQSVFEAMPQVDSRKMYELELVKHERAFLVVALTGFLFILAVVLFSVGV